MASAGDSFIHPTGACIDVVKWDGESDSILIFDLYLPSRGGVATEHAHHDRIEKYQVRRGEARYRLNSQEWLMRAGDHVVFFKGARHIDPWNDKPQELMVRTTLLPALDAEQQWLQRGFKKS